MNSTNLQLPYLAEGQAQKHVTVNETIRRLDAVVQVTVESATTTAEPGAPSDGQTYIMPSGKTGTNWDSFPDNAIAYYRDGAWEAITPGEGWLAFVRDADRLAYFDGSDWTGSAVLANQANAFDVAQELTGGATIGGAVSAGRATNISSNGELEAQYDDNSRVTPAAVANNGITAAGHGVGYALRLGAAGTKYDAGGVHAIAEADFASAGNRTAGLEFRTVSAGAYAARWRMEGAGHLRPSTDNAVSLGAPSYRTSVIYSATGTINTSDAREKSALRSLTPAEQRAVRRIVAGVGIFQWKQAVARKGADGARLHCGVTAQAIADAFAAEGLDPQRYGLFCADEVIDEESGASFERLGVRYDQLFAMALATIAGPLEHGL